jgi:transcriptional regulator with XRE-family HTH domain
MSRLKRTTEDDFYAERFGERLEEVYEVAKKKGVSDQKFAQSIGVERPQLRKYLRGEAVPSVRTIALAQRHYGIGVSYDNIEVSQMLGRTRRRRKPGVPTMQLRLPFSLQFGDPTKVEVELKSLRPRKYELRIKMKQAG